MPSLFRSALLPTLVLAAAFAAPSSSKAQNAPAGRLRVMVPLDSSASFDHALTDVVRQFNASQSRFQVELSQRGSPFQNLRAIIAAHYAGDLPDLALVAESDLPTLAALGIVQSPPESWLGAKKLVPGLVSASKCKGLPCSVPFQRRVAGWFFNRELLFKLNQETEKIPASWKSLSAMTLRLHKPNELWGAALPASGEGCIPRWTALGLGSLASAGPVEATAKWLENMWALRASWVPGSPNADEATRRFMEQRAVILLGTIDQWGYLKTNAPFKLGASLPEGELAWFGTDFVMLNKASADRAREFIDYLFKPEVALTLFRAANTLPVSRLHTENGAWKRELEAWPLVKAALGRKSHSTGLEKIAPHVREEWANTVWLALEQTVEPSQRASKAAELKASLQKILSANPR